MSYVNPYYAEAIVDFVFHPENGYTEHDFSERIRLLGEVFPHLIELDVSIYPRYRIKICGDNISQLSTFEDMINLLLLNLGNLPVEFEIHKPLWYNHGARNP